MGWIGITVIVGSGILATVLRARALPNTPASDLQ
jgi:S-adenosylmethionine uptake transporter